MSVVLNNDGSVQYTYAVREVTLVIKTPVGGNPPSEWNWPSILEVNEDEVELVSENYIGESVVVSDGLDSEREV